MKNLIYFLLLGGLLTLTGFAQNDLWEIRTIDNQPYVNVTVDRIDGEKLYVKAFGTTYEIKVSSVNLIKRERPTFARSGSVLGMMFGGGITVLNQLSKEVKPETSAVVKQSLVGILIGGAFGYAAGALIDRDIIYDLKKYNTEQKLEILKNLFSKKINS